MKEYMASRNRTNEFIRLRESYASRPGSRARSNSMGDPFLQSEPEQKEFTISMPPEWMSKVDEITYDVERIKTKSVLLQEKHKQHLLPNIDDDEDEQEKQIEILTSEITRLFQTNKTRIKNLATPEIHSKQDQMRVNIQQNLAIQLQDLSTVFRTMQREYLQRLRGIQKKGGAKDPFSLDEDPEEQAIDVYDKGFTQAQTDYVDAMDRLVDERDRDIAQVVKSIIELQSIFNDLAMLIIDQGTILDRIDYNLEQSDFHVKEAVVDLRKASEHQKSMRLKLCILILLVLVMAMAVILIFKFVRGVM